MKPHSAKLPCKRHAVLPLGPHFEMPLRARVEKAQPLLMTRRLPRTAWQAQWPKPEMPWAVAGLVVAQLTKSSMAGVPSQTP